MIEPVNVRVVVESLEVTETPWESTVGLLGRDGLQKGEGLLIEGCRSIHTWFMRFPIDVVFLDEDLRVARVASHVGAWRMRWCWSAKSVLELPAGAAEAAGLKPGQGLCVEPAGTFSSKE